MKMKCIKLFTWNLYIFYVLLLCIQSGLTLTKDNKYVRFKHPHHHPHNHRDITIVSSKNSNARIDEAAHAFQPTKYQSKYHNSRADLLTTNTITTTSRPPLFHHKLHSTRFPSHIKGYKFHIEDNLKKHFHYDDFHHSTIIKTLTTTSPSSHYWHRKTQDKRNEILQKFTTKAPLPITMHPSLSHQPLKGTLGKNTILKQDDSNYYDDDDDDDNDEYEEHEPYNNGHTIADFQENKTNKNSEENTDFDDEYFNDDENAYEEVSSLTDFKNREYGTVADVQRNKKRYVETNGTEPEPQADMEVRKAMEHRNRVYTEFGCHTPRPRIVSVSRESSKIYSPHCTVLHQCANDLGCCKSETETCMAKTKESVKLYFIVKMMNSTKKYYETLNFENHTECHCVSLNFRPKLLSTTTINPWNTIIAEECKCPKHFVVIPVNEDGDDTANSHHQNHQKCSCDCAQTNSWCTRLKNGTDTFTPADKMCIRDGSCVKPTCKHGQYKMAYGRCPTFQEKHNSATKQL